ncbi:hypothetical protein Micbo1qcDRAFT_180347 [Microdochium bolleyi]|uniref:SET domain-containing protein n=1 Tax=Microdochium bolleyi TaxID=196109 RepID=A0A136IMS1_9PEZI|nr:hypothetical protein Micbo1qcDRAFT_180347 [Microdochium bolleyi]
MAQQWPNALHYGPSKGKGRGFFATADIPIGSVVLAEVPAITLETKTPRGSDPVDIRTPLVTQFQSIMSQWHTLPPYRKDQLARIDIAYMAPAVLRTTQSFMEHYLGCPAAEMCTVPHVEAQLSATPILAFFNNAFEFRTEDRTRHLGLYPFLARMNHSCEPNLIYEFDKQGKMYCVTARDIEKGEEFFISYLDTSDTVTQRERKLFDKWTFTCTCRRCQFGDQLPALVDVIPSIGSYSKFTESDHGVAETFNVELPELWRWIQLQWLRMRAARDRQPVAQLYHLFRELAHALYKIGETLQHPVYLDQAAKCWANAARLARQHYTGYPVFADACFLRATEIKKMTEFMKWFGAPHA